MKKLSLLLKFLISRDYRDYRYVRTLHVFDPDYYVQLLQRYFPETYESINDNEDPLWVYFENSRKELDGFHFTLESWQQCCDPHPLFDTYYYVSRYRQHIGTRNPFAHYLIKGWKQGLQPSPFLDTEHYAKKSGWSADAGDPLTHFVHHGLERGMSPSSSFNVDWYLDQAHFPQGIQANTLKHYKLFGSQSGKCPVPVFETQRYLDSIEDNEYASADPFLHYLCTHEKIHTGVPGNFDSTYYKKRYLGDEFTQMPLLHYLRSGVFQQFEVTSRVEKLDRKPVISIVVPVFNVEHRLLRNCIRSVLYQSYPYWELYLVDDCSDQAGLRELIMKWETVDKRISCIFNRQNLGISGATQAGVEAANGEFVGFLDNDDELDLDCLYQVVKKINKTGGEVFYTDEDLIGNYGSRHAAFFKPAFNKALLYSHNYITHFVVVSKKLYHDVGGLSAAFDGAQDYDLMLKLSDTGEEFHHISNILYHWRATETSTSIAHDQKPYAHEAGRNALVNCLKRNEIKGQVTDGSVNFHYHIEMSGTPQPSVTVILLDHEPVSDSGEHCLVKEKTDYEFASYHYLNSRESGGSNDSNDINPDKSKRSKAHAIQDIIDGSDDEFIAILGNGAADVNQNWLAELVSKTYLCKNIGIVCGRAIFDGTDGPSYAVAEVENNDPFYYAGFIASASRHAQGVHNMQWVNGCDWHICLISRTLIDQAGGFDYQQFPDQMAMLDLSYRVTAAGKRILYIPDAVVMIPDKACKTVISEGAMELEKGYFTELHYRQLMQFEKYYNIGQLLEQGYSRGDFYHWLTGTDDNQDLTEQVN